MFGIKTVKRQKRLSNVLMEAGIDSPANRAIIHLLSGNEAMLYSELVKELGMENARISGNIQQLIQKNLVNREINSSLLALNRPFLRDKGFTA